MTAGPLPEESGIASTGSVRLLPWLLIAATMFVAYSASFSGIPVVEQTRSVVGDADAAAYIRLWEAFRFGEPLGDPYRIEGRTHEDVAEKHRLHHPVSAATGHYLTRSFSAVYALLGLPEDEAPFAVNALWGALNILLLGVLMRRWNGPDEPVWPFLLLYGVSLSPWLYASLPDSWALTTTLFLVFLLLVSSARVPGVVAAAALGLFMLNNMALAPAILFLWLSGWRESPSPGSFVKRSVLLGAITVGAWAGGLTTLSLFDPAYRLDRLLAYSAWFREYVGASLPLTDPYVWKSVLTNLFVNSVVSNQPDPNVPQEALLHTLQGGWLGRIGVAALAGIFGLVAYRAVVAMRRQGGSLAQVALFPVTAPLSFCLVMVAETYVLHFQGAFTYATLVVPVLVLLFHRFLELGRPLDRVVLLACVTAIVVNNVTQILEFRTALAALG